MTSAIRLELNNRQSSATFNRAQAQRAAELILQAAGIADATLSVALVDDQAARESQRAQWSPEQELLLYFIHGLLHATGFDDTDPILRDTMFRRQREILLELGLPAETVSRALRMEQTVDESRESPAIERVHAGNRDA